ncbi:unnamed protein product [Paramecium octaurelia]|uniref:Uncharacterized protein n=1 Tax=Paramecium octaurelia TaxID=43137 RepID=A0A8S1XH60_PAROT|nr:unnamed protein product [Paramecium octaurelia]
MGVCKIGPSAIKQIELKSDFEQQYQGNDQPSYQYDLRRTPPCEIEIPTAPQRTITNNNHLYPQNHLFIKQVESFYNSTQTNKVISNEHQCHNEMNKIDELSKSLLKNETQPDDNPDKQAQIFLNNEYEQMLSSKIIKPKPDIILRTDLLQSVHPSKYQGRVKQQGKTL